MSRPETSTLFTRFQRLFRLFLWLLSTAWQISRLNTADQAQRNALVARAGRRALAILNIRLHAGEIRLPPAATGTLIVANHVSWLDIFALAALLPAGFIAKQEIRRWPLVGRMAANVGTVFINRSERRDVDGINRAVAAALQNGRNVCFFPEAQTSDGLNVLPFKAALFQSAADTGALVQPVALRYCDHNGRRSTLPSYTGHTHLLVSLWRIVSMPAIELYADVLPPLSVSDRYAAKDEAERQIRAVVGQAV
ncbi:1-acylglycerol-3-phosphate O-acyltransferase [Neisseria leonii]|uniref:1-acyl-sn-glycerol-3-phosphate acyltransferase n=1 Tax=Neisseria leonii TaxID=2995413 RepID=A0A9X4E1L2_9NEIS|nr:1-acylglycerol-3-phosphate O-acyltransferase [Neisseria sp. 51.81]MDD9327449.1 1-acylglycerol-3-phosphate O-acyltransferase [Neisseria sp. 51.81]